MPKHTQGLTSNPFQNKKIREYFRGPPCIACGQEIDCSKQPQGYVHWGAICPDGFVRSPAKPALNCMDSQEFITQENAQAYEDGRGRYAREEGCVTYYFLQERYES